MGWVNAIIQGVLTGGLYALFACGLSLMFGVMKVVNLAHGDLAVVAGYVAIGIITVTHVPVLWSFLIVVPVMAAVGYVLQRTVIQSALDRSVLTTLLVTFGLSVVIENGLLQFFTANSRAIGTGLGLVRDSFTVGSQIQIAYLLVVIFAVAVVVLLGLQYFLSASKYGRLIRAGADDREAVQLAGADYRHVFGIAAAVAFGTVALAGMAYGMYSQLDPTTGTDTILLFAFAAVVIGGLGSLWGTLLGGVVLGVAQQIGAQINISDAAPGRLPRLPRRARAAPAGPDLPGGHSREPQSPKPPLSQYRGIPGHPVTAGTWPGPAARRTDRGRRARAAALPRVLGHHRHPWSRRSSCSPWRACGTCWRATRAWYRSGSRLSSAWARTSC